MPDEKEVREDNITGTVTTHPDGSKSATATAAGGQTGSGSSSGGVVSEPSDSEAVSDATREGLKSRFLKRFTAEGENICFGQ